MPIVENVGLSALCPLVTRCPSRWRSGLSKQGLGRASPLVTPSLLRRLFCQLSLRLASMSPLVTHAARAGRSPGWPPARPGPGQHVRGRGSSSGSVLWPASAPGLRPCSPSGRRAPSSNAGAARCAGPGGTTAHSSNTCVVFASSSAGILRPTMMRLSTLDRDVRRRRTEENEEAFTRSFWKKTPPKKTAISHRLNHYTFRSVLAPVASFAQAHAAIGFHRFNIHRQRLVHQARLCFPASGNLRSEGATCDIRQPSDFWLHDTVTRAGGGTV